MNPDICFNPRRVSHPATCQDMEYDVKMSLPALLGQAFRTGVIPINFVNTGYEGCIKCYQGYFWPAKIDLYGPCVNIGAVAYHSSKDDKGVINDSYADYF